MCQSLKYRTKKKPPVLTEQVAQLNWFERSDLGFSCGHNVFESLRVIGGNVSQNFSIKLNGILLKAIDEARVIPIMVANSSIDPLNP